MNTNKTNYFLFVSIREICGSMYFSVFSVLSVVNHPHSSANIAIGLQSCVRYTRRASKLKVRTSQLRRLSRLSWRPESRTQSPHPAAGSPALAACSASVPGNPSPHAVFRFGPKWPSLSLEARPPGSRLNRPANRFTAQGNLVTAQIPLLPPPAFPLTPQTSPAAAQSVDALRKSPFGNADAPLATPPFPLVRSRTIFSAI